VQYPQGGPNICENYGEIQQYSEFITQGGRNAEGFYQKIKMQEEFPPFDPFPNQLITWRSFGTVYQISFNKKS